MHFILLFCHLHVKMSFKSKGSMQRGMGISRALVINAGKRLKLCHFSCMNIHREKKAERKRSSQEIQVTDFFSVMDLRLNIDRQQGEKRFQAYFSFILSLFLGETTHQRNITRTSDFLKHSHVHAVLKQHWSQRVHPKKHQQDGTDVTSSQSRIIRTWLLSRNLDKSSIH